MSPPVLCRLAEIADGQAKGFTLGSGPEAEEIFVLRRGERVYGYRNVCPHAGSPLDWTPDRFISPDGRHIQCHTHGALFALEDGRCLAGPCLGQALTKVQVQVDGPGRVVLR